MITRKWLNAVVALAIANAVSAQTSSYKVELPQLLPASPEPTAFIKAGVGNVNMSTGAATANIPLYTIKLKDFSFPLSLSYSTQGLKADEASSRVGYGWVLNATAMITRVVKGKPDEFCQRLRIPSDFATPDSALIYCAQAADPTSGEDTQPDEFQFNCNGFSGKFVLDDSYTPRITSTANIKIDIQINVTPGSTSGGIGTIVITTPDGVKYTFGNNYEITTDHNIMAYSPYKLVTKTAFFLDRIDLPAGGFINFNYAPVTTTTVTGITQTFQVASVGGDQDCGDCLGRNSYSSQENRITYNTKYLTGISTSDSLSMLFTYEQRTDQSNDNRLKTISVGILKKYEFEYYDVPIPTGAIVTTGRFFLTKVRDLNVREPSAPDSVLSYSLTYNHMGQVPLPVTFSQDYLGFYNGKNNNCLIPPSLNSNNTIDFGFRNPNPDFAAYGTLSSIIYPTGGVEEYFYEGNTQAKSQKRNTYDSAKVEGSGGNGYAVTYHTMFTVKRSQSATMSGYADDAILNDGFIEDSMAKTAKLTLYDGTVAIASREVLGYSQTSTAVNLVAGHTYKLEMSVTDYRDIAYASVYYDSSAYDIYDTVNVTIPGVRLKRITLSDPVAGSVTNKFFTYASLENLEHSSGSQFAVVDFHSDLISKTFCGQLGEYETDCLVDTYSSSSTSDVYATSGSGSPIYYKTVIESDDPDFANGGTEYTFFNNESGSHHEVILGEEVAYLPAGQFPTLSGVLQKTTVFDKDLEVLSQETNDYETFSFLEDSVRSIYVRKKYEPWPGRLDAMDAFDVVKIVYENVWNRLKTKTKQSYAGGAVLTQRTNYTYGTRTNVQPYLVTDSSSTKDELKIEYQYPTDFPASSTFAEMVSKNRISAPVVESSYRNGVLQQQRRTSYRDWFNDSTIILPDTVHLKQSTSDVLHHALLMGPYDHSGNLLKVNKANDMRLVYLWDSLYNLPVCEVRNADSNQVAFSGFEQMARTNWQVTSGSVQTGGFTGDFSFSGTLTKNLSGTGKYIVTLWTNSPGATVNSTGGTALSTKRGWTLYQWVLTNPASVTVQGTYMDDVRLYPKGAFMTTYTYIPFVGVQTVSDANSNAVYYEYDTRSRLLRIRDLDSNIIKQYQYRYQSQTRFFNIAKSGTFTRNNCSAGGTPGSVTYTVAAGTYNSSVSQADADQKAQDDVDTNGQQYANATGTCTYYNVEKSGTFTKSDCATGATGSSVTYTVLELTYSSTISQADADAQAQSDVNTNGQAFANTHGSCTWYNTVQSGTFTRNNCPAGYTGSSVTYTVAAGTYSSTTSQAAADQLALNDVSTNGQSYANANGTCTYNTYTCTTGNCSGADKKCINNVCETGTRVNTSSVYMKNASQVWVWRCTYHYVFSDCSVSADYTEDNSSSCSVQSGCGIGL